MSDEAMALSILITTLERIAVAVERIADRLDELDRRDHAPGHDGQA